MAARSTGMYPREGFNLDEQLQVPLTTGGTVENLGCTLEHAKTVRVIIIGGVVTGDGYIEFSPDLAGSIRIKFTAADLDANGVGIAHFRGALMRGKTQDAAFGLINGTGSANATACYIELLDTAEV